MDVFERSYEGDKILLYHGETSKNTTGYKYIVIYTNSERNQIYIYKIRGINIDEIIISTESFGKKPIFFD